MQRPGRSSAFGCDRYAIGHGRRVWSSPTCSAYTQGVAPPPDSDERFRAAFESAPTGMAITDMDGWLLSVNGAMCRTLGYEQSELIGRSIAAITHPEDRELEREWVERVVSGELDHYQVEKRFLRKDGEAVSALLAVAIVRDGAGKPHRAIGQILDLSEIQQLQEKLRQSQRMESLGRLAGGVAHDFNNLLTVVEAHLHRLERKLGDDGRRDLDGIRAATRRATRLTTQLLTFSRGQVTHPQPVDLNQIVDRMTVMLTRLLPDAVQLDSALDPDAGWVGADPARLEQIVMNLVINARDAMPDGGRIRIQTRSVHLGAPDPTDELEAGDYVELSVSDEGHGMDAETREQAMEPFFTTKAPGAGTGLGLSTIYGVVKQLCGSVTIESEPGEGATFRIRLPRVRKGRPRSISGTAIPRAFGGRAAVLLVEDETALREVMASALRDAGHTVLEAGDGRAALDVLAEGTNVDVLVTDVIMPTMGGKELVERVERRYPKVKVIFMSGYADDVEAVGALSRDSTFLNKPFSPAVLLKAIADQLGG